MGKQSQRPEDRNEKVGLGASSGARALQWGSSVRLCPEGEFVTCRTAGRAVSGPHGPATHLVPQGGCGCPAPQWGRTAGNPADPGIPEAAPSPCRDRAVPAGPAYVTASLIWPCPSS